MELRQKIKESHEREDALNIKNGLCDKAIFKAKQEKKKLAKSISKEMKYRNRLINLLQPGQ